MSNSQIIEKIRKLIALASNNPNEAEAESAMRMATTLLARHNLDLSEVATTSHNPPVSEHRTPTTKSAADQWVSILAHGVAPLYFSKVYLTTVLDEHFICYVGRPHNTLVAAEMVAYLQETITKLSFSALAAAMFSTRPPKNDQIFLRSFREGATSRIFHRIADMIKERDAAPIVSSTGTTLPALASTELALVDDYLEKKSLRKGRTSKRKSDNSAYWQGDKAGAAIGLHNQLHQPHGAALRLA